MFIPPDIYFKIIQNDPGNRNYGFTLQRIQNDNWVNIHTDSTNAKSVFNYLNFIFVNGTYSHQEWISKLWISVDPNIWLGI